MTSRPLGKTPKPARQTHPPQTLRNLLPAFFAAASLLLLASLSPTLFHRISSGFQVQQDEAINVEFGRILYRGDNLYPDINQGGPYIHCSYPPLFPYLQSLLMRCVPGIWLPGRLLAFGGYLGCGLLLAGALWRRTGRKSWAVLMAALLWLFPTWAMWGSMVRLDTCLQFLNFSSFLLLWWAEDSREKNKKEKLNWVYAAAGILNALALLMKPTALTLTLAYGTYAILRKSWKEVLLFLAFALIPIGVFLILIQSATQGFYWIQTVRWAAVELDRDRLLFFLWNHFIPEGGWLLAGIGLTLWLRKVPLLLKCQLAFATLSLWTLSRDGAAQNYYMEFLLYGLLTLAMGWAVPEAGKKENPSSLARYIPFLVLLAGVISVAIIPGPTFPSAEEAGLKTQLLPLYQTGEDHLALDTDLPVMAGKRVWYQHSGILAIIKSGSWDPKPLLNDIRRKKFSTIELYDIPHQYLLPQQAVEEIEKNYHPFFKSIGRVWLAPNPS